jgi:sterol desaturase/sphingolipid hydroxylase (fatty acid hydroxylase superfamily)
MSTSHLPIDHTDIPIRLFKSDFLEFFTHISPLVVLIFWLPVSLFFLVSAILTLPVSTPVAILPIAFILGLFLWTFAEYTLHRFLFHYAPKGKRQERIIFLFHGVHHAQPQCKTRLVMPPVVSIPMALVFYALFTLIFGIILAAPLWVAPVFSGFILGYLLYDLTHYATHHFKMRTGYLKFIKRYHLQHHYKTPDRRYGVTSPIWDSVFKTRPAD